MADFSAAVIWATPLLCRAGVTRSVARSAAAIRVDVLSILIKAFFLGDLYFGTQRV
jgi:hypothetical protein